jgi:hypothetical protein
VAGEKLRSNLSWRNSGSETGIRTWHQEGAKTEDNPAEETIPEVGTNCVSLGAGMKGDEDEEVHTKQGAAQVLASSVSFSLLAEQQELETELP